MNSQMRFFKCICFSMYICYHIVVVTCIVDLLYRNKSINQKLLNRMVYLDQIFHTYFLHCPATGMQSRGEAS